MNATSICTADSNSNPDISGIGVRISFYVQNFLLVLLVDRSWQDAPSAIWTFVSTSFGLTIAATIQARHNQLSLLQAIEVSNLTWLANFGTFLSLASYSRRKVRHKPTLIKLNTSNTYLTISAVVQTLFSMSLTLYMWINADHFGNQTGCTPGIKYVIFVFDISALGAGRIFCLTISSSLILVYLIITSLEIRSFLKSRKTAVEKCKQDAMVHKEDEKGKERAVELPPPITASSSASTSTPFTTSSGHNKKTSPKHLTPSHRAKAGLSLADVDPTLLGIATCQIIVFTYFVVSSEILLKRNADLSGTNQWGFGQIVALVVVVPAATSVVEAFSKHGIRRLSVSDPQSPSISRSRRRFIVYREQQRGSGPKNDRSTRHEYKDALTALSSPSQVAMAQLAATGHIRSENTITSSVTPGIGYLSSQTFKKAGTVILKLAGTVKTRKQRRIIAQVVTEVAAIDFESTEWQDWLVRNEPRLDQVVSNLANLSSGQYGTQYQEEAIKQASIIQNAIVKCTVGDDTPAGDIRRSIVGKLSSCTGTWTSGVQDPTSPASASQPVNLTDQNVEQRRKARFRRRLRSRWTCGIMGHSLCFSNRNGVHIPLSEESLETWVAALDKGEATLLCPPKIIAPARVPSDQQDAVSIGSSSSSSAIQYQRSFSLQSYPSLTDLRSMQVRVRNSLANSSSLSSPRSGIPGIGYLPGMGVTWIGLQILKGIGTVEISRRKWVIGLLVKEMGKLRADEWERWLIKKERKVTRAVEDVLELSSEDYKEKHRKKAIKRGSYLRDAISNCPVSGTPAGPSQDSIVMKLFPIYVLSSSESVSSSSFASDVRETILQETASADENLLQSEFVAQICYQLAYGDPSEWRYLGYATLWRLVRVPVGREILVDMDQRGVLMKDLAKSAFQEPTKDVVEHATAIKFFSIFADAVPALRDQVLSPTALPLLIDNIHVLTREIEDNSIWTIERLCSALYESSPFSWCIPTFVNHEICPSLVQILIHLSDTKDSTLLGAWTTYSSVLTLRNVAVLGGDAGARAFHGSAVDNLQRILLSDREEQVRNHLGSAMADHLRMCVEEMMSL